MLLARLEEDAISRPDDLDRAAATLAEADALQDEDRLAVRMRVPRRARAPGVKWTLLALTFDGPTGAATVSR
jgi:hypothetical protein